MTTLEQRCDELQANIDQMKRDARMKKKETTHRTWSVPSLNEDDLGLGCRGISISGCDFLGMPSLSDTINDKRYELQRKEIKDLKDTIKILKLQNFTQERMKLDVGTTWAIIALPTGGYMPLHLY